DYTYGLGSKLAPFSRQCLTDLAIILDDPVEDDGQLGMAIEVGMRVGIRRPAMGSPSRVADAEETAGPVGGEQGFEIGDLAGRLPHLESHPRDRGDARRVIPAVLEPTKPRQDESDGIPITDVADDATHRPAVLMQPLT